MILKVFGVYDMKACAYMQPFFSGNAGSAMRAFGDAVTDGKSTIAAHPGDYQLFELGSFDDNSGAVVGLGQVKLLCAGSDYVAVNPVTGIKKLYPLAPDRGDVASEVC